MVALGLEAAHETRVVYAGNQLPLSALWSVNTCSWSLDGEADDNIFVVLDKREKVTLFRTLPSDASSFAV